MLKNFLGLQATLLLTAVPALAQLYIGPSAYMQVSAGTTVAVDSVLLIPSADLSLNNINFLHSNTPLAGPGIRYVATSDAPFNFQGTLGLYYTDAQLNGNTAANLQLAYRNGVPGSWITTTGTTVNTATHFLSRTFTPTVLSGITATSASVPLPVAVLDLAAYSEERHVRLDCEVGLMDDNAGYELERSLDGKKFAYLEQVPVIANRRSYTLYDSRPETGANFYRLRKVGGTGNIVYSRVCKVIFGNDAQDELTLYPVPANDVLYLNLRESPANGSYIILTSMDGKTFLQKELSAQAMTIDLHAYASGSYILAYYNGKNVRHYKINKAK